jgi:hypothetical protein
VLHDPAYRYEKLKNVTDPTVHQFWQAHDELPKEVKRQHLEPITNRLQLLFMGRPLVRNIIGQRDNTVDCLEGMHENLIVLIKAPVMTLGTDAYLIGKMILAQIHAATFSMSIADLPPDKRPGLSLYIDEAAHFAIPQIAELFSDGRKYGVRVCLFHQWRSQLPSYLAAATMSANTIVSFRVTPEDSRELAPLLWEVSNEQSSDATRIPSVRVAG